jgi:inner membrane protein
MPTAVTHVLAGLALAEVAAARPMPAAFYGLSMGLALLPDADVLAFRFGIPYGSRFGHRGFSHSLCCAGLVGLAAALLTAGAFAVPWWLLWIFFAVVLAEHGALDALTNGGMGVAFFSPFDNTRYFFPWTPVQVAPIGWACLSRWGLRALLSEIVWIWLPLAALVGAAVLMRTRA